MKYLLCLATLLFLCSCKDATSPAAPAPVVTESTTSTTSATTTDLATASSEELINVVLGTHQGQGTLEYDNADSSESKILNAVKIERRDAVTVIVSSPENLFPSYEIGEFRLQGHKIYGKVIRGYGFILYDTNRKRIMALVKRFDQETASLRFAS